MMQVSVTPGLSTNGMHAGGYSNYFSLNLTAGYSAANYAFELGVISNLNVNETRGLQIAGLTNFTGANAFAGLTPKEKDLKIKSGFEANLSGAQFSGLANVVLFNVFGWQTAGGANVVKGSLQGFQIAGIGNSVRKYTFGGQLSGVFNVSAESVDGFQLSGLFNVTGGELFGVQVSAVNKAGRIEGRNSFDNNDPTGIQIGLVNHAARMNGFQIGLVNIGKRMQGTQIGIVNIYRGGKMPETRDGTSIGLVNIGSGGYAALYVNELFLTNVEIATGTIKNSRMNNETKEIQIQNALIYSNDPGFMSDRERWAFGYGLKKMYFTRSSTKGMNKFRFWSFGIDWLHINHESKKLTRELSLLTRPTVAFGSRLHPKLRSIYVFAAATYALYLTDGSKSISPYSSESSKEVNGQMLEMWPGFSAGVHIQ